MNMMTRISLLVLASLGLAVGCQKKEPYPKKIDSKITTQVLRLNIVDEPQSLDPRKARSLNDINLMKMLMEGLTRANQEGHPEMAMADKVDVSNDGLTYTFHIRNAKWSTGESVKASDFVYAWKKVLSPEFPASQAFQLFVIKNAKAIKVDNLPASFLGAKAIDDHTLVVQLEHAIPYFLDLVSLPAFFPISQTADQSNPHWAEGDISYVNNGPFTLKTWKHKDRLEVVKNNSYWDVNKVKLNAIDLIMVSEDVGIKMFENKELDWEGSPFSTIPLDAIENLKGRNQLLSKPSLGTFMLRTNVNKAPFHSALVRQAFAVAINREKIVDFVTLGGQIPATRFVPETMELSLEGYFPDGNIEEAKNLLTQAIEQGEISKADLENIILTYAASDRYHRVCQAIQDQWQEAFGINIQLEAIESKIYFDRVSKSDYQLASGSWIGDFNDPITFLDIFRSKKSGSNNTGWEDSEFTALLDQSFQCTDPVARKDALKISEQILMKAMPVIPIYHYSMLYVKDKKVKSVVLSNLGTIDFKWAYIDEKDDHATTL